MNTDLQILILAGKRIDEDSLRGLVGDIDVEIARYSVVSRGVRRLETDPADVVLLVPDADDTSFKRAIRRCREEYGTWSVLVFSGKEDLEPAALQVGAYAAFALKELTPKNLPRCFHALKRQRMLEAELEHERNTYRWIEEAGRLGSWEAEIDGAAHWSDGVRRIMDDKGMMTNDFSSVRPFVHPDDLEIFDQANRATFEQGWPLDFEYRVIVGDGETRYLHLHRRVEHRGDGKPDRVYGMVRDVTPEREFENFLFRRDAMLHVVGSFADQFLRDVDWQSGIDETLAGLGKAAEITRTFLFRKDGKGLDNARFSMTHEWTAPSIVPIIDKPLAQNQSFSPMFDRWKTIMNQRKVVAGNIRSFQSEERKFFERLDTKSILMIPVFVEDEWWGFFGLTESQEEREWMPAEIESMTMVAEMFGAAILRSRMESQLKAANRSAESARTDALEASRAKSRFLANMSHEIRTPISGILGMAEMTITTGLTTEQREHMDMIRDAAKSLLSIVNDILDISKIEADKMELKPEDFDLRPLMETTIRHFEPEVRKKPVAINLNMSSDIPAMLHGDGERLGQVLRNLIGNALKFTEQGYIDVSVKVSEKEAERVCLHFTVQDSGEGIAPEMLDTVFDSFTQADSSVRKKHQGTGLGLTISREFVQMMGGNIGAESELGVGSTFSFTVWLDIPEQREHSGAPAEAVLPKGMHLNILMAEDNLLNQKFLTHFLSMFGHTVTVAENGIKALEALERMGHDVDLILMDIQMPEMGGMETTQRIRESTRNVFDPQIPIIALTAYAMKGDKERMFAAGMDDYVSKPVDMKELSAAIARAVAHRIQDKAKAAAAASSRKNMLNGDDATRVTLDMDSLISRFDGNMELLSEILDLFLSEADDKLAKLDASFMKGDLEELGMAIHSITNISSHVLAMDIVEQARELERRCYRETLSEVTPGIERLRPQFLALVQAVREKAKTL